MTDLSPPRTRFKHTGMSPVEKYSALWMNIATVVARESSATRKKVGCVVVTPTMGLYTGYNGVVSGDNKCEDENGITKVEVVHAEQNAFDKMLKEGVSSKDSVVYITLSPCIECAKRILNSGVRAVYFYEMYRCSSGVEYLRENGLPCYDFLEELEKGVL